MTKLSRREFLRVSVLTSAATVAAACVPAAPATVAPEAPPEAPSPAAPEVVSKYQEAPMLGELVAKGELPPVDERVPENPFVIEGLDGIGNYGGGWRMNKKGQADTYARGQVVGVALLEINQDLEMIPRMAESWETSADATEWTFRLRRGIRWSDGQPMTSEDFRFWYEDLILNREYTTAHPKHHASIVEGEAVPCEFSAPDDFTVKYKFALPNALFYYWGGLINSLGNAVPSHFLKPFHPAYGDQAEIDALIAGNDSWDDWTQLLADKNNANLTIDRPTNEAWINQNVWSDELVSMERNPYYWEVDTEGNQLPYIDKLRFHDFIDPQVAIMRVVNGEIDCQARHHYGFGNYTVLKEGEATGDYTVQMWRGTRINCIYFNLTADDDRLRELFQERDFRIAVSYACNRDEMRELLLDGFATNMQYSPPKGSPLYYPKLSDAYLEYDPDRANAMIDALGYDQRDSEGYRVFKDGSGERIAMSCIDSAVDVSPMILMLIDYFKDVGLQMTYQGMDRSLFTQRHFANEVEVTAGDADRNLIPLADPQIWVKHNDINMRGWPQRWAAWYLDPSHPIAQKPPEGHWMWDIWGAWEEIQRTADEEKQKELFWSILDIWVRELPAIGLYGDMPILIPVKNGLKGIHEGYGWDCCSTSYEHCIDNATWYWDEPEKHTF